MQTEDAERELGLSSLSHVLSKTGQVVECGSCSFVLVCDCKLCHYGINERLLLIDAEFDSY